MAVLRKKTRPALCAVRFRAPWDPRAGTQDEKGVGIPRPDHALAFSKGKRSRSGCVSSEGPPALARGSARDGSWMGRQPAALCVVGGRDPSRESGRDEVGIDQAISSVKERYDRNRLAKVAIWLLVFLAILGLLFACGWISLLFSPKAALADTTSEMTADYRRWPYVVFQPIADRILDDIQRDNPGIDVRDVRAPAGASDWFWWTPLPTGSGLTASPSLAPSATVAASSTLPPSATASPTWLPTKPTTRTATTSSGATNTPVTPSNTPVTPSNTPVTPSSTATQTPTWTATPTATASSTPSPTLTPTDTPTPTPTDTPTSTATDTPTP